MPGNVTIELLMAQLTVLQAAISNQNLAVTHGTLGCLRSSLRVLRDNLAQNKRLAAGIIYDALVHTPTLSWNENKIVALEQMFPLLFQENGDLEVNQLDTIYEKLEQAELDIYPNFHPESDT